MDVYANARKEEDNQGGPDVSYSQVRVKEKEKFGCFCGSFTDTRGVINFHLRHLHCNKKISTLVAHPPYSTRAGDRGLVVRVLGVL